MLQTLLANTKIIPIITVRHLDDAVPLAEALINGGFHVLEITLRTPVALQAISDITRAFSDVVIAAGTIIDPKQFTHAKQAGAQFAISPATTPSLIRSAEDANIAYLPGVSTCHEILLLRERGFRLVNFFPAEQLGGIDSLNYFSTLFPDMSFCPCGGVDASNAHHYLSLPNVTCIGSSWLTPQYLVENRDWAAITELAKNTPT